MNEELKELKNILNKTKGIDYVTIWAIKRESGLLFGWIWIAAAVILLCMKYPMLGIISALFALVGEHYLSKVTDKWLIKKLKR